MKPFHLLPVEDPGFCTVEKKGENRSSIDLELGRQGQVVVLQQALLKTSKGAAWLGDAVVYILDRGCLVCDYVSQVREMSHCVELVPLDVNLG